MAEGLTSGEVAELYRRYGLFLRRRCRTILRSTSLAEDALQDTFLKLMKSGAQVRDAEQPMRWLYRVADRACFDQLRKRKTRHTEPLDDVDVAGHPAGDPELRQAALEILTALDEENQQICVMAFLDGMSQQEIADELGYSRNTIVTRIGQIRKRAERMQRK